MGTVKIANAPSGRSSPCRCRWIAATSVAAVGAALVVTGAALPASATPSSYDISILASSLTDPRDVAVDSAGDVFIADSGNNRVLEVPVGGGSPTVVAGTGAASYSGDGGLATSATLNFPMGLYVAANNDLYIADFQNNRIRRVDHTTHNISTVAGNGTSGSSGDGAAATAGRLNHPRGVTMDSGDLYIADTGNNTIREVDHTTGFISTVVGTAGVAGATGDGGAGSAALLNSPESITMDTSHHMFIADTNNHLVRQWSIGGSITTYAGSLNTGAPDHGSTGDGGPATSAKLYQPSGVALDASGNLFIADSFNHEVREVEFLTSTISTIAGDGVTGAPNTSGLATASHLGKSNGVAVYGGTVYSADNDQGVVEALTPRTPPIFTASTPPAAVAGQAYAGYTFTASGSAPIAFTVSSGSLPAGMGLNSSTGALSGTPTSSGSTTFSVTASNGNSPATTSVTFVATAPVDVATPTTLTTTPVVVPSPGAHRLAGDDRVSTSVSASATVFPRASSVSTVVLATNAGYADSLAGARLASAVKGPLLLTDPSSLSPAVAAEIQRVLAAGGVIDVLGGERTLAPALLAQLAQLTTSGVPYQVHRVAGDDRFETAVTIADQVGTVTHTANGTSATPIYLANGRNYPDGLAVSALAARTGGVVLLTDGDQLPPATAAYLAAHDPAGAHTVPVGGAAAQAVAGRAGSASGQAVVGSNRYDTARLLATSVGAAGATPGVVGLASGQAWPDALTGAAVMGSLGGPLLLTTSDQLAASAGTAMAALTARGGVSTGLVFGGQGVVGASTVTTFAGLLTPQR